MKKEFKYKVPISAAVVAEIGQVASQFASKGAKGKIVIMGNGESVTVTVTDVIE